MGGWVAWLIILFGLADNVVLSLLLLVLPPGHVPAA